MSCSRLLLGLFAAAGAIACAQEGTAFHWWRLEDGRIEASAGATDAPLLAGSLQKPFVVKAWAAAHPGAAPPRVLCPPGDGCWDRRGHGELGLARATALSCNAYFRALAAATPESELQAAFRDAGFLGSPRSPDSALGRLVDKAPPRIRPSELLRAYHRLVREPWPQGEEVRQTLLEGLRDAARSGTAGAFSMRPGWAKTGTVPLDGLRTAGLALMVEESGTGHFARLDPGTGREASLRLASLDARSASAQPGGAMVAVRVLELLAARPVRIRNLGPAPIPGPRGFLGPGAEILLAPGEAVGPGLLEATEPRSGMVRRFRGRIEQRAGAEGRRGLVLHTAIRDYVAGVLAAELADPADPLRIELGAAALRFLAKGPRHPDADVCDSTHCAWFVGLGPALRWDNPAEARMLRDTSPPLSDPEWKDMQALARQPGPAQWTSHCGGRPLSERALWGSGDGSAQPCPRHPLPLRPWVRDWSAKDLARAFGGPVEALSVMELRGRWTLRATVAGRALDLDYDEAHRRLARPLGWGALPSPADSVERWADGYRARGVGLGHRVGLCLGE